MGVVSSADFNPLVNELINAGKTLGIQIVNREVASDKAALHEFRRLIPVVEGFIILPECQHTKPRCIASHGTTCQCKFSRVTFLQPAHL